MKKHLALLCGVLYPNPSATGQVAKRFAELLSDEYDIDILCLSDDGTSAEILLDKGMHVFKLAGQRMHAEAESHGIVRKLLHLWGGVQIKTLLLGNLSWYRSAAFKKLEEIHHTKALDAILSVCSPFAAHYAAMDFKQKHPQIRWCGYTVDPYAATSRVRPIGWSFKRLAQAERSLLLKMDTVLLSEEVYQSRSELYAGCRNCRALPYILPEFTAQTNGLSYFDPQDINCVYAGSFYRDIRNPVCMLEAFASINNPKIKLHLYSYGCEDIVCEALKKTDSIVQHTRVPASEITQVYAQADVLVSIGNTVKEFMPSKTFEYIASGKPIIHFYAHEQEQNVLGRYPLCFQVHNAQGEQAGNRIEQFLLEHGRDRMEQSQIKMLYARHAPENIAKLLKQALGN